jgi:hypothetical protein
VATTATLACCLAIWGATPAAKVPDERVDLIEINHFHDDQGRPVFDQIIFYDWSTADRRYQIRDWRLLKNQNQVPMRRTSDGDYVAVWSDFKSRDVMRQTQAKLVRETWTQYDPELVEREFLPEGRRRKLREMPVQAKTNTDSPIENRATTANNSIRPLQTPTPR